jgi:geranylgeranyl diphosphate/geranylgeranyl-bacteriochlorophyllide a reductase
MSLGAQATAARCDVAVVGAGPAGCWAAHELSRRGARVTLVDGSHPREKPCGGGVTGRALALVSGAVDTKRLPACSIQAARFVDSARNTSTVVSLGERALVVAGRMEFDGALLAAASAAGATVVRSRALDVTRDAAGFVIQTRTGQLHADMIIGADGANSLVRRKLARPFDRADLSIATGYFVHGVTSREILLELVDDPPGYIWSFPRPTHLAVGICAQADAGVSSTALRARATSWIRDLDLAGQATLEPYSWPIPSLTPRSFESLSVSGPGWFLVGDAAGLVDPVTREGIYFALRSGEWAAGAASASRATTDYQEQIRDEIVADLRCAARYKAKFFAPWFRSLLLTALGDSGKVRDVMADLIAGDQPYATLKWSLIRTAELGLAWRLVRSKWYNRALKE